MTAAPSLPLDPTAAPLRGRMADHDPLYMADRPSLIVPPGPTWRGRGGR